jgi:type IV pilus assembly protein PilB
MATSPDPDRPPRTAKTQTAGPAVPECPPEARGRRISDRHVATLARLIDQALAKETDAPEVISPECKQRSLAREWGLPFVDLRDLVLDKDVIKSVPAFLLKEHKVLPIRLEGTVLTLAMASALNVRAIDEVRLVTGYDVHVALAVEKEILAALDCYLGLSLTEVTNLVEHCAAKAEDINLAVPSPAMEGPQDLDLADDAPVIVRLVALILAGGISCGASDVHIQPEEKCVRVRYRCDGVLRDASQHSWRYARAMATRLKVMSRLDIAERRRPQDGRISLTTNGKQYDLRVSTFPGLYGEKIVLRLAERNGAQIGLDELGFAEDQLKRFEELVSRPYGMILVSGPTGSGKTTTLYSVLHRLNDPEKNIMTVEDPIERRLPGVNQAEVSSHARSPLTFASALRSVLRQDPDIIMVGEIRDHDTALIATQASLTGHLVLSTLHTNDAPSAPPRLLDMGIEPFLVSSSVIGILAQRLVRVLCPRCKERYELPTQALSSLNLPLGDLDGRIQAFKACGCSACEYRGYRGRIGVFELLVVTDEIRRLILRRAPATDIAQVAREQGMVTMLEDALTKVCQGVTSVEEMLRVIDWA